MVAAEDAGDSGFECDRIDRAGGTAPSDPSTRVHASRRRRAGPRGRPRSCGARGRSVPGVRRLRRGSRARISRTPRRVSRTASGPLAAMASALARAVGRQRRRFDQLVHEADGGGPLRVDGLCGQQQLLRVGPADLAREHHGGVAGGVEAEGDLLEAEGRVGNRVAKLGRRASCRSPRRGRGR